MSAPTAADRGAGAALDHLALLAAAQREFAALLVDVDPRVPVPWCGRWRVRDLAVHLARIHHWAAGQARRRQETPLGRGPFELSELYPRCAAELLGTLHELDPAATAWTLVGDGPVAFWHRRQLHETLVHLWDLRAALAGAGAGLTRASAGAAVRAGREALPAVDLALTGPPGPEVWADTVAEVVDVMHPRQVRLGRAPAAAAVVRLVAPDAGRSWLLAHDPCATRTVTVSGPAAVLALMLWRRADAHDPALTVEGDAAALDEVLAERLTP